MIYKLVGATFVGMQKIGLISPFFLPFWAPKWAKIQVFDYFVKKCPLDSHQSCFICLLGLLSETCTLWPQRPKFWAIWDPKVSKNSGLWLISQNVSTGFTSIFHHMLIASTSAVYGIWTPEAQFGGHLGTKLSQNSGLWPFSQTVFTCFTSVLLHMLIPSGLKCVEN